MIQAHCFYTLTWPDNDPLYDGLLAMRRIHHLASMFLDGVYWHFWADNDPVIEGIYLSAGTGRPIR